jgi:hypothetical protein
MTCPQYLKSLTERLADSPPLPNFPTGEGKAIGCVRVRAVALLKFAALTWLQSTRHLVNAPSENGRGGTEMETIIQQNVTPRDGANSLDSLASILTDEQANEATQVAVGQMYEDAMTAYHLARAYDAVLRDENSTVEN